MSNVSQRKFRGINRDDVISIMRCLYADDKIEDAMDSIEPELGYRSINQALKEGDYEKVFKLLYRLL